MTEEQKSFERIWLPTLTAFTEWTLTSARKAGIQRLYFLARDAFFPYLIAQRLQNNIEPPLPEIRYLEGSRYSFRMAEFALPDTTDRDIIDKLCVGGIDVTLRKIFRRGGLTDEEIKNLALKLGQSRQLDRVMTYRQTQAIKAPLLEGGSFVKLVRSHSSYCLSLTQEYLRQEGLQDDIPFAIVDSGWVGSIQQTLSHLLHREVEGYYFGLYELPGNVRADQYHTFAFAPWRDVGIKTRFSNCLFEAVCSSPKGMTVGYQRSADGRIAPVYEKDENPNADRVQANADVIRKAQTSSGGDLQPLLRLMSHPTETEAALYGNYLFSDDVNSNTLQEVASGSLSNSAWPEGLAVRTKKGFGQKACLAEVSMRKQLTYVRKKVMHRSVYR